MDIQAYLHRIGYEGPLEPGYPTLRSLHLRHMLSVPFENLDIHLGRPILLDIDALFQKIVLNRRGGFCYELNGLFAVLLEELGFEVRRLSARDVHDDGSLGLEFDHLVLLVRCPAESGLPGEGSFAPSPESNWVADVGWGDSFREPLLLGETSEQEQFGRSYRLEPEGGYVHVWQKDEQEKRIHQFRFGLQPYQLADFAGMCYYHQTSPESIFTRHRICTLATPEGRVSLDDSRLIITQDGQRQEFPVESPVEYQRLL